MSTSSPISLVPSHSIGNRTSPASFDETAVARGGAREIYRQLRSEAGTGHLANWKETSRRSRSVMRDLDVTFNAYQDEAGRENILPFDPFPRIIDAETWDQLSRGLVQRVRLWNEFLRDIHDSQEVLRSDIVPFDLVFDDPRYQRGAVGVKVPEDTYIHFAAFDLARDAAGKWVVIDDFLGHTTGVTYALQARNVLSQSAPEIIEAAGLQPVRQFPTELLEHLRGFAHGTAEPRVVLLAPGPFNSAYYEHSSLARQMGIPLVHGGDLIVLNSRCFLKTIGGLEPIDVIYRRVDEAFIDPVAFRADSFLGVPGLMTCVRKGTVTIANAIGSGLGENRAIASYLSRMARFYANEALILPTVERRLCGDPDQLDEVVSHFDHYLLRRLREQRVDSNASGPFTHREAAVPREQLEREPGGFVAEPRLPLTLLPTVGEIDWESRHAGLRCFVFGGQRPRVFPLALTRFALHAGSRIISSGRGGGIKDTWILRGAEAKNATPSTSGPVLFGPPQRRLRLGSRIADSLFWMGRYKARAETTTRVLKVLQEVQLENPSFLRAEAWAPLWEALARATGHDCNFFERSALQRQQSVSQYLLLDRQNPGSVLGCVSRLRENARATREAVPPEVWAVINQLWQTLEKSAQGPPLNDDTGFPAIQSIEQSVLDLIDQLSGTAAKNMLRGDAWEFWTLGRHVERALTTTLVTRQVLLRQPPEIRDEIGSHVSLDALLRMLACQYAYRSLYQTRPTSRNVVALVLQDPALPRSVLHCLDAMQLSLGRVTGGGSRRSSAAGPLRTCAQLIGEVEFADLEALFPQTGSPVSSRSLFLDAWLEDLASRLMRLATEITDQHLHHQAFNILR